MKRCLALVLLTALALVPAAAGAQDPHAGHGDDHAEKMRHEHAGETPTPSGAASAEPAAPVSAEPVVYATSDGREVTGYLVRPEGAEGALPGLIVIQEWWGLNDNIRAMARRFAGEGYVALAVDLYEGQVAESSEAAYATMTAAMERPGRLTENLRQAHAYLKQKAGATRIGVVGWCFGGGWSLRTALDLGDGIDAAVMYYGRTIDDPTELGKLRAPLLGLFGGQDQGIPVAGVRSMEKALGELGKQATIVVYEDADHAFANPSGQRYDEAVAADAWQKTTAFFAEHLK
jgi:carboxymethylenebutenolidase